ncbi:hypothetical protein H6P80_07440 [Parasphingopyxis sp. GrpM-11]|uniref:Uncharacterized protein n=1 Tax=Parasphingopyxis marina TaxID=2761622 RepID=A0A842HYE1_9SPHN|nr:hypothetical protein [Parasphingopyxis marina]
MLGSAAAAGAFLALAGGHAQEGDNPFDSGPPTAQSNPEYTRIDSERGAVLCSWMIVTEMRALHRRCHADEPPELTSSLDRSLDRFHTFIVANSDDTRDALEARVASRLAEVDAEEGVCAPDGEAERFYQLFISQGATGIDEMTEFALAVPRPPVLNPCL